MNRCNIEVCRVILIFVKRPVLQGVLRERIDENEQKEEMETGAFSCTHY